MKMKAKQLVLLLHVNHMNQQSGGGAKGRPEPVRWVCLVFNNPLALTVDFGQKVTQANQSDDGVVLKTVGLLTFDVLGLLRARTVDVVID